MCTSVFSELLYWLAIHIVHKTCLACKCGSCTACSAVVSSTLWRSSASCIWKGGMLQDCLTATLPIVLPSLCLLSHFLANNGNGSLALDGYAVHQRTAEWWRESACYGAIQLTGCGLPAEETSQSGGNHWRACCAAAEPYTILRKAQPSSLRNYSICLCQV